MAVAAFLGKYPRIPVERRNYRARDISDPTVILVDTGRIHDPTAMNFDHHQDETSICALSLVLDHYGVYNLAKAAWPWLHFTESLDTAGLAHTAHAFGIGSSRQLLPLLSPVEKKILEAFGRQSIVAPGDLLHSLLVEIGKGMWEELEVFSSRCELLASHSHTEETPAGPALVVDLAKESDPTFGTEVFCSLHRQEAKLIVSLDKTHAGSTLVALTPSINFRKATGKMHVNYVDKAGLVARTKYPVDSEFVSKFVALSLPA